MASGSISVVALTPIFNIRVEDSSKPKSLTFDVILWLGRNAEYRVRATYYLQSGEAMPEQSQLYIATARCAPLVAMTEQATIDEYELEMDVFDVSNHVLYIACLDANCCVAAPRA